MNISFPEWQKIDIRIAVVKSAERIEGSEKLLLLKVHLGSEERQVVAGIAQTHFPDDLIGRQIVVLTNLEPKKLMGYESQGMLLAASGEGGKPILLTTESPVPPGSKVL